MKKNIEDIKHITINLLNILGFSEVEVSVEDNESEIIEVQIDSPLEDKGLLIGFHGENISALQTILGHMINKDEELWKRISVNVGDYREKRQESLEMMAINAAQRVKLTQKPVTLPHLSSNERRIVHLALSEDEIVETYSVGDGRQRRLLIDLKKT